MNVPVRPTPALKQQEVAKIVKWPTDNFHSLFHKNDFSADPVINIVHTDRQAYT